MVKFIRSSVLILYREIPQLEIVIVQRAKNQRAFPAHWVFPGGKVDEDDLIVPKDAQAPQEDLMVCCIREFFEETGILPAYSGESEKLASYRKGLLDGQMIFSEVCQRINYKIPISKMINLGRRVTPPIMPFRFDTSYFLLKDNNECNVDIASDELAFGDWLQPEELLEKWRKSVAIIPPPIRDVLEVISNNGIQSDTIDILQSLSNSPEVMYRRIEYHPGITFIPVKTPTLPPATHTNCYLIGHKHFFIIDPATPYEEEQELLLETIKQRIVKGHVPEGILLTHHHQDHIGSVKFLKEQLNISVSAHEITAKLCEPYFQVEHFLEDEQILPVGKDPYTNEEWNLQVIFSPGHAPGHLCFIDLRHKVAIVGDMVAGIGTILIAPPEGHMRTYISSLQKLKSMNLRIMFPAHGNAITQPEKYLDFYISHRLKREKKVILSLKDLNSASLEELLPLVYDDVPPEVYPLASQSLLAHLIKLEEDGVIVNENSYRLV